MAEDLKMSQEELIEAVHAMFVEAGTNVPKKFSGEAVKTVIAAIKENLKLGKTIAIKGFGNFKVSATPSRRAVNPKTQEIIQVPSGRKVSFKPSVTFKVELNKPL